MVFGGLIIFFLIVEPHGLARLWQIAKEKLGCGRFRTEGQRGGDREWMGRGWVGAGGWIRGRTDIDLSGGAT